MSARISVALILSTCALASTPMSSARAANSTAVASPAGADPTHQAGSSTPAADQREASEAPQLHEVVVTAEKRREQLSKVPISMSVLNGNGLDQSNLQGVTDALGTVPGVAVTNAILTGGTQIAMRGVTAGGPTFTGASTVAYYLDGVPFGFVKSAILPDPDVFDLDRVEVLRGPQSTLYGANAENGVVRVLTNDPDLQNFDLKLRAVGSGTEDGGGNYGGDTEINVPVLEGKVAIRGVVDYQNLSGWIDSEDATHVNDAQLRSYRVKVASKPTDALTVNLEAWSTRDNYGAPSSSTAQRTIVAKIPEPITTDWDSYNLNLGYELPGVSISSTTSYLDYANESALDFGVYGIGLPPGLKGLYSNFFSKVFTQELTLSSSSDSVWQWTAGAFYRDDSDRNFQNVPGLIPAPVYYLDGSKSDAVYGELSRRLFRNLLKWTLGGRYYHDDERTQELIQGQGLANVPLIHATASSDVFLPRAVLTWYPDNQWTAYGSFSEGFRSGFPQDPAVVEVAPSFAPVKPDRLYNYELGAKADLPEERLSVTGAIYFIDWKNIQQLLAVPYNPSNQVFVLANINAKSASGPGVDFGVTARPVDGLEVQISLDWNRLRMDSDVYSQGGLLFSSGDRLDFSPALTGGASIGYEFPVSANYSGRFTASGNYVSGQVYHRVSLGAEVLNQGDPSFIGRIAFSVISAANWTGTLFVDNATNNYGGGPDFGSFGAPDLSPRPRPRTIGIQFDYHL